MITLTYQELNKAYEVINDLYKEGYLSTDATTTIDVKEISDSEREYLTPQTLEFRFYNFIPKGKWILETEVSILEETEEIA